MEIEKLIDYIRHELENGRDIDFEYKINGISYIIKILTKDIENGINISSILLMPLSQNINNQIIVEANNLESDNFGPALIFL